MLYNNLFKIGDKVKISNKDSDEKSYIIGGIIEREKAWNDHEYQYKLRNIDESSNGLLKGMFNEEDLEIIQERKSDTTPEINLFMEYLHHSEIDEGLSDNKPKFRIGDVVNVCGYKDLQSVKEIIEFTNGQFQYDTVAIDDEDLTYRFEESSIEFQYHDPNYEFYYTESVGNSLPKWRGKVYNFYMFYKDPETHGTLDDELVKEYNNHTIPPKYMEHILESHSVYDRIEVVIGSEEKKKKLMQDLQIDKGQLKDIAGSIHKKINARNLNELNLKDQGKLLHKPKTLVFSNQESAFVDEICKLDDKKDIYPLDMTNLQIMGAIKEAYENAYKTGRRRMQQNKDKQTGEQNSPTRGQMLYRGESNKYKLTIEFWYNFDLGIIETAYPVTSDRSKKH